MKAFTTLLLSVLLIGCLQPQEETKPAEINWIGDYSKGLEVAKRDNKPALLYFWASWCPWCKKVDEEVLPNPAVAKAVSQNFVPVKIDIDAKENEQLLGKYNFRGTPTFVVVDGEGRILASGDGKLGYLVGYRKAEDFLQFLGAFAR